MIQHHPDRLASLVRELASLPHETEWLEFKRNNEKPEAIGEYISALSNSAALADKAHGYLVWGVADDTHEIVGTTFEPRSAKVGNEELENWLLRLISPKIPFQFLEVTVNEMPVVVLEVGRAYRHPVQFQNNEFVRIGSYRKKLKDFPEKERALWRIFDEIPFEALVAAGDVSEEEITSLLDYPAYFDLAEIPLPENRSLIVQRLQSEGLVIKNAAGKWDITNLGAVLFAKRLEDFPHLKRKAVRVIAYDGNSRIRTLREQIGGKGYGAGFEGLIGFVNNLLPSNEVIGRALRRTVPMYPELAIRELVANALIHQDFSVGGAGPMIEIFADRMEISNPGVPLVDVDRFLDTPPRSRNEALASLMRRFGICEERGSGVDKVVSETEAYQLPAPEFAIALENTRASLFAHRPLAQMDKSDRIRACYLHACLRYVSRDYMTNTSLRERFGIEQQNSATASRYIKEAVEHGVIRPYDEAAGRKYMKYVPHWA
ncbi:ATP-binding protein [Caballeronia sp. GAOx1]|uniref:ATP-binding protein n=1 Tax=Caballeronia sp. GAOx1 TaxID=2921761 RepID=UPI00202863BD|nr:ATP-binding protein [Caballeronia sp. GAOx1]